MPDAATTGVVSADAADAALAYLTEMSAELRGAAILDPEGSVLAATGDAERWGEDSLALLRVADEAGGEPVEQLHIGAEQGEVFAVRQAGLTAVAVTERFVLSSLMFFDMRSVLRELLAPPQPDGEG